jgi:hypothetical protein
MSSENNVMYHIFGFNYDIPTEMGSESIPESEINERLASMCKEYYELLDWNVPNKLTKMAASTSESDTTKLIKLARELSVHMGDYCRKQGGCDNKGYLINGIVKGGATV